MNLTTMDFAEEQNFSTDAIKILQALSDHIDDAVNSLKVAFACDESR
ncbi:MAG: hypothetical protein IPO04_10975 [Cytophagaceae bacterium]|nr:hypothetical protein [Cytophagaceae bacterium]